MRFGIPVLLALTLVTPLSVAVAQTTGTAVTQAFDHYEAIRVLLADDKLEMVSTHAKALAPLAGQIAGKDTQAAVEQMAAAKTLDSARDQFVVVSSGLVPKFIDAKLPGVHAFMCPMKTNATWAQRTANLQNPYFGKAMLTCGSEITATK
jgi:hypothetical protein